MTVSLNIFIPALVLLTIRLLDLASQHMAGLWLMELRIRFIVLFFCWQQLQACQMSLVSSSSSWSFETSSAIFRQQLLSHIYIFWRTRHAITKVQVSNFTFFQMINVWNSNIFSSSCTAIVCLIYNYTWKQQKCYNSSQCNVIGCFFIPCCEARIVLSGCIFLLPCFHSSITLWQSIVWPHLGQMLACLKAALTWLTHLFLCHKLRCDQLEKSVDCYWGKGFWCPLPIF